MSKTREEDRPSNRLLDKMGKRLSELGELHGKEPAMELWDMARTALVMVIETRGRRVRLARENALLKEQIAYIREATE